MAEPASWKLSQRLFERFLIYRLVQDTDMVWPARFSIRTFAIPLWLHRHELGQNVIPIGDYLNIKPLSRFGQAKGHTFFIISDDRHSGNLPPVWINFKRSFSS